MKKVGHGVTIKYILSILGILLLYETNKLLKKFSL